MNPIVIFEVLSDSTESYDRGAKFRLYSRISSLQEYVLVSQNERIVEVFRRNEQQRWELYMFTENDNVELASVECTLTMDEIYEDAE
jgi:Uma2 family endonuclease